MIATARPFALSLVPDRLLWRVALAITGSALIALSAQVALPVPGSPVPVSGQTFAVLLVGAALGSRLGAATVALYIFEGAGGLPVWTPVGAPGAARLVGPTGGFIVGFLLAAFVVGLLAERGWDRRIWTAAAAMLVGNVVVYLCGLPGLAMYLASMGRALALEGVLNAGLFPFVLGDLYKIVLASVALPTAWRFVRPR